MQRWLVLAVFAFAILLTGCGPSAEQIQSTVVAGVTGTQEAFAAATATIEADSCRDEARIAYADGAERLLDRYENQVEVVGSTPRVGLGAPLQRLVDYEDEARDIVVPECLANVQDAIMAMMETYRDAYQNFAAQGAETTTMNSLAEGEQLMRDVRQVLSDIREGFEPQPITIPAQD